jgi:hypothetical protein
VSVRDSLNESIIHRHGEAALVSRGIVKMIDGGVHVFVDGLAFQEIVNVLIRDTLAVLVRLLGR